MNKGAKHHRWKGDDIGYQGIHRWLKAEYKKICCDFCSKTEKLEWALKKGKEMSRDRNNYFVLCVKCHRKYDAHPAWNKGLRTKKNKICEYCGEEFYPKRKENRFCSRSCSAKGRRLYITLNK